MFAPIGGVVVMLLAGCPGLASAQQAGSVGRTWFVKAGGAVGADGSPQRPFGTLSAVEQASGPGDTVVVLPSPASTTPLDGGIALKAGQNLVGGGPAVADLSATSAAPRITNTSAAQHSGDAVTLADGAEVSNVVISDAYRGGIYGSDVRDVRVHGNDVSATNTSCTTGFVVQPFTLPTLVPGVGVPFGSGLSNGWAAIMVDETRTATTVSVDDNYVHDSGCADGIDIRASGTSQVSAQVAGNTLTRLRQDPTKQSELAIGMQTTDTGQLTTHVDGNSETYIGTATLGDFGNSDSEGLFGNSAGRSHLIEYADRNTFAHGLGHISANCVEFVASNGGPTMAMSLTNSTCNYVVGDILEAANLSRDASLVFNTDHVLAAHSTFIGSQAFHAAEPGDDGDCLLEVASGSASTTTVNISNSQFTDCVADGLGVVSNVVDGAGARQKKLSFAVANSRITANRLSNLRVANVTPITELDGKIERTDLSRSASTPVILEGLDTSRATDPKLDLGGGSLGSEGHNCIYGGAQTDVTTVNDDLSAKHDWWGDPDGPATGRTVAAGASITYQPPLGVADCGPAAAFVNGPNQHAVRSALACAPATGKLAGRALGPFALGITRTLTRAKFLRRGTRGRRDSDFYCLSHGSGIRVGYATEGLLGRLSQRQRARLRGRAILLLTANRGYSLRGVQIGDRIATAARVLPLQSPFRIGRNSWYLVPGRLSTGVLEVVHGIVREVGIADRALTSRRSYAQRFLAGFAYPAPR